MGEADVGSIVLMNEWKEHPITFVGHGAVGGARGQTKLIQPIMPC
jgi:hypothetical protein